MEHEKVIKDRYEQIRIDALAKPHSPEVTAILKRGTVCCINKDLPDKRPFLLTGINPSYIPGEAAGKYTFINACGPYWTRKRNQFGDLVNEMAYMDLFPLRETHQKKAFEKEFKEENELRARFLCVTQDAIEDLQPRLIVHANRDSLYYWGLSRNPELNPWMCYQFQKLTLEDVKDLDFVTEERLRRFPFYSIKPEFIQSEKRINQELTSTSLAGTTFIEYVMEERKPELKALMYTPEEWRQIWEWAKSRKSKES